MEKSFQLTVHTKLQHCQLCPILINVDKVWDLLTNGAEPTEVFQQLKQEIALTNSLTEEFLIYGSKEFLKGLRIPWQLSLDTLKSFVENKLKQKLETKKENYPEFVQQRWEDYSRSLIECVQSIIISMFETIEECIDTLVNERFPRLMKGLRKILQSQMQRITYDLYNFCALDDTDNFFLQLKQSCFDLVMEFATFIYQMSYFGNVEMDQLNEILKNNTCLANIDTYKVMQVEISKRIYCHTKELLQTQTFFRPEFHKYIDPIVFMALKHFYTFAETGNENFSVHEHPATFREVLPSIGVDQYKPAPLILQVFSPEALSIQQQVNENPDQYEQLNHEKEKNLLYQDIRQIDLGVSLYENAENIYIEQSQDVKHIQNGTLGVVVTFANEHKNYGSFLIFQKNNTILISQFGVFDPTQWGPISSIEQYEGITISQFIQIAVQMFDTLQLSEEDQRLKSSPSLEKSNQGGISFNAQKAHLAKKDLVKALSQPEQGYLSQPELHHKHLQVPKKPIRYGTSVELVAGKTLGTGIGYLIVNCLDEDMPWDEKLKDAGYSTMTLGCIALISSRLPVVGIIIQQVILAYAVTITVTNKVVDKDEKLKNLGHLAVQIGIGVVCIVGGHILIPFHFWGAFFGGLFAGVGIGLYSKFVVPKTMVSLLNIIEQLDRNISPEGSIYYSPLIVQILHINENFFLKHKPDDMSKTDWLTLSVVCLVNEVHYMYQLLLARHIGRVTDKLKSHPNDPKLLKDIEESKILWVQNDVRSLDWRESRQYCYKFSILEHHEALQEFIEGMIENFKIP